MDDSSLLWRYKARAERAFIARALMVRHHNRTHAATLLGISRRTLLNKINDYGLTSRSIIAEAAKVESFDDATVPEESKNGKENR